MQVRSRSSSEPGSDLKDTTKIFQYSFQPPSVSIAKSVTETNRSAEAVTLTATPVGIPAGTTPTYTWQVRPTGSAAFTTIAGQTGAQLVYSAFETDDGSPSNSSFTVASIPYEGRVWEVDIRVIVNGGNGCTGTSSATTISKITGVDP